MLIARSTLLSCSLLASVFATGALHAGGTYFNLGAGRTASGAANNGTVVGYAAAGAPYWIWTQTGGIVQIGGVSPGNAVGGEGSISDDGAFVGYTVFNTASGFHEFARYEIATGISTPLGGIGAPCSTEISSGWGMSGDGNSVVGLGWLTCNPAHAAQWTSGVGPFDLGSTVPGRSSRANGVDFDGNVVVGWQDATTGFRQGAIWVDGVQSILKLGQTATVLGEASDVSSDGTWVTGSGVSANGNQAWRWSEATGGINIGPAPTAGWRGASVATNADGSRILLFYRPFPGPATFGQGFIWTPEDGMVNLNTWLVNKGVSIPAGVVLALPLDISADGNTIVGIGRNGASTFAFAVILDEPCPADLDASGAVDAADLAVLLGQWGGTGTADLDSNGTVDAADLAVLLGAWGACG
jgi:hypothetical protein